MAAAMEIDDEIPSSSSSDKSVGKKRFEVKKVLHKSIIFFHVHVYFPLVVENELFMLEFGSDWCVVTNEISTRLGPDPVQAEV